MLKYIYTKNYIKFFSPLLYFLNANKTRKLYYTLGRIFFNRKITAIHSSLYRWYSRTTLY